jgi:hypothetical protein
MEMRVIIHSPHESFDQASGRSRFLGFGLLRRINVADGSLADKPSGGSNPTLSAVVRKRTNYCDAAIVRFVPLATIAPQQNIIQ